ncbi:MAG: TonB-dependent receptor [Chitinophagaceae bacterium]
MSPIPIEIHGRVIDREGNPLQGVSVLISGTKNGTTTNSDGHFALTVPGPNTTLEISNVGFQTKTVAVGGQSNITITLENGITGLNEVVVVGYGTQQKKDIIGSVAVVNTSDMRKVISRSAQAALQGLASGVNVINSGIPGAASKIFIRGITSFGNTDPLVIVDGIEQNLNTISTSDIESIQVLKDAGAAAIYGVRGANGVIVVTTKKGKTGTPVISYEGYYGMQYALPGNPYNVMNSTEWMQMFVAAYPGADLFKNGMPDYTFRGPGGAGSAKEGDPRVNPALYVYGKKNLGSNYIIQKVNKTGEDWFHNVFKKAPTMSHGITASGGTEKSKYLFGLNYLNQEGTFIESFEKRYSARVNTSFTLHKNIRIGENVNIIYRQVPGIDASLTTPFRMVPLVPLKDIMGNWAGTFGGPDLGAIGQAVAIQDRHKGKNLSNNWFIIGNAYAEVDFLKDFTARTSIGYNVSNSYVQDFNANQPENIEQNTNDNSLSINSGYGSTMTWTNTLNYNKVFDKHEVKVLIGSEAIETTSKVVSGGSARFFSDDFNYLVLNNGTTSLSNSSSISSNSLFSIFGRLDYQYNNKYLAAATIRRDGSSRFGPESRYGIFPSFSLGWRISQEGFMKKLSWLDDLKLRGSYGVMGSQNNVSDANSFFLYNSGLGTTYYDINGTGTSTVSGFAQSGIGNVATGWEEDKLTNVGFDATMLNGRLNLSAEYYKKKIYGLLFSQPLPAVVLGGATAPTVNIGDIQNTGMDISVRYRGMVSDNLGFSTGLNVTTYKNTVVNIPAPGYFDAGSVNTMGNVIRNQVEQSVSSFYGYKVLGLFNSDDEVAKAPKQSGAAPGTFRYQDTNNDRIISADDRIHMGNPNPDFTYGITLGVNYKGLDLSGFFYGSQGNEAFNALKVYTHFLQTFKEQKNRDLLNAWTPQNTNTTIPKLSTATSFSTNGVPSSFFVEDASYLKLRSLSLGYTINSTSIKKVGISLLRLYVNASNLFTVTRYSGIDPELGGAASNFGIDYGGYPTNELSLVFGLNITF